MCNGMPSKLDEWAAATQVSPIARALQIDPQKSGPTFQRRIYFHLWESYLCQRVVRCWLSGSTLLATVALELPMLRKRQPSTWDLFGPSGEFAGMVQLPDNVIPHVLTENGFVGVMRDDLDVEYIVRFAFTGRR